MPNTWLRFYSQAVDDEKLRVLAFEDRWHYIALLCCKSQGILEDKNPERLLRKIAIKLEVSVDELREIYQRLASAGLVTGDSISPTMEFVAETANDLRPSAEVWMKTRERIFMRDDYTCAYCDERGGRLECDHVVPVSRGGSNSDDNLVTACFYCNRSKRDKLLGEWRTH